MHKLRIVLVTLITVCFLSACSTASKMPDNDDLLEMLPQDLIESSIQAPMGVYEVNKPYRLSMPSNNT